MKQYGSRSIEEIEKAILSSCEADECPSWLSGDIGQLLQELNFTIYNNIQEVVGAVIEQDSPSAKAVLKADVLDYVNGLSTLFNADLN